MRAPPFVSEFFEWRWAPCVGLTAGSLAFVALALLLIPTHFEGSAREANASSSWNESGLVARTASAPRALLGASLPRNFSSIGRDSDPTSLRARPEPASGMSEQAAPIQRGFSPIIDRPEPPAPPPPAPPPPVAAAVELVPPPQPAPAPAPSVVIQQPQQPDADGPRREVTVQ